jgi:diketogulonate reductase-like aldo/keto reductase
MSISAKQMMTSGRPYLLYGTAWKGDHTAALVTQAIHAGFRFIDTACQPKHYNEAGVGKGWTTAASQLGK